MVSAVIESLACLTAAEFMQHLMPNKAPILPLFQNSFSVMFLPENIVLWVKYFNKILTEGRRESDSTLNFGPRPFYHIALERVCDRSVGALPHPTDPHSSSSPHQYLSSCDIPVIQLPQDGLQILLTSHCGCICCLNKRTYRGRKAELGRQKIFKCSCDKEDNC